eukprot:762781-Hanusia_phi.AAC.6
MRSGYQRTHQQLVQVPEDGFSRVVQGRRELHLQGEVQVQVCRAATTWGSVQHSAAWRSREDSGGRGGGGTTAGG